MMQKLGGPIVIIAVVAVVLAAAIGGVLLLTGGAGGGGGLTPLSAAKNVASLGNLSLSVPPDSVPQDFQVGLTSLAAADFDASKSSDQSLSAARAALPAYLKAFSPIYTLKTSGSLPKQFTLALSADGLGSLDTIDLYTWDGKAWAFLPSLHNGTRLVASADRMPLLVGAFQTAPTVQVAAAALEVGQTLKQTGSTVDVVEIGGLTLQGDGSLQGGLAGGFAAGQGYAVLPLIRTPDDNGAALNAVLADLNARQKQVGGLVDLVNNGGYDGVALDYRGLDPARTTDYNKFIAELSAALHQQNKTLAVVVPSPTIANAEFTTGAYDLKSLGANADIVELPLGDALTRVGDGSGEKMIAWATGLVSRFKLRLLASTYSADQAADGSVKRVPGSAALSLFGSASLKTDLAAIAPGAPVNVALSGKVQSLDYDTQAFAPRFTYLDDSGATRTVFFVTSETLEHQLILSQKYNVGGVTVRDLFDGGNPPGMLDAIVHFKLKNAALTTSSAALGFTVKGPGGVVYQATAAAGQPFTWTAGDPGQYSIAANLLAGTPADLGSVDVVVPSPRPQASATRGPTVAATATRRVLPTATPCGGPCPTETPAPPTNTPGPATATSAPTTAPAGPISGGGAWGPFELGGQAVHGGIPHAADMKRAGMTWVKIQGHYGDDLSAAITSAHNQGFKILLSVVGDRGSVMDPGYQVQYGNYMANLATQGADALEIWNEPNIDREWPTGQVSGANYASLLKTVYPIIKGASNSVIVISAAPAPTGFFGGSSCGNANGCDDRNFLTEFVAAGGGNYLDCIGAHYNEGIVPPDQIGTDPRDNYFTRYYGTMLTTYSGIFNAARPICFTELGYLTGEGYPPLAQVAPGFAWAANTTIAQQAQWLAQAAALSKANSNVRLMIVFNVDFSVYGADPQAGYAIERADGTCPACDALAGVMH